MHQGYRRCFLCGSFKNCFVFFLTGVECPSCRKSIDVERDQIGSLPRNLALENIVIRYTEERSTYHPHSDVCASV